jgi:hypothetical protein
MIGPVVDAQTATQKLIPHELLGKWVVVKELNTRTISCWGEKDAKKVLGTSIEYSREALSWGSFIRRLTG